MNLKQQDKDLITGIVLLIISILAYIPISQIRWGSKALVTSAAVLPLFINIFFTLMSIALIAKSVTLGGRFNAGQIGSTIKNGVKTQEFRNVLTAMLAVAVLVFLGVPYIGFFISGGIFMFLIIWRYVKTVKPVFLLLVTAVSLLAIYGIFVELFKIQLK